MHVLTGICPKKIFGAFFLNVRKKIFNPLNGTLTKIWSRGGGRSTIFPAGHHRVSQGNSSRHPQLKGASFAPARSLEKKKKLVAAHCRLAFVKE